MLLLKGRAKFALVGIGSRRSLFFAVESYQVQVLITNYVSEALARHERHYKLRIILMPRISGVVKAKLWRN